MSDKTGVSFDTARFKAIERAGYNQIARRYAAAAIQRDALNRKLTETARLASGMRVLDLASGPGTLSISAAGAVGADGMVIATDLAEAALGECAASSSRVGCGNILCAASDAEALSFATGSFDRVLCGLGLMVFPDAERALSEVLRVLKPGGAAALSVWGREQEVPLVACALVCMRRTLPAPKVARPSIFRFGDAELLHRHLQHAGFTDIRIEPFPVRATFPDAATYWQAFLDLAGGAAWSLSRISPAQRAALATAVEADLAPFHCSDGYVLNNVVLIASARRCA